MPSTSKSKRRKHKKQKRNWLDIPTDVMADILFKVGVFDILENAQKVCTKWRQICKDPAMWRVIDMDNHGDPCTRPPLQEMCKHAVDRSQGQLVDLTLVDFANPELLLYIADRSSQLKRLDIWQCYGEFYYSWTGIFEKFPLLEELSLYKTDISAKDIEGAGKCCPKLTTLNLQQEFYRYPDEDPDEETLMSRNGKAITIAKNLPNLKHLQIVGDSLSNMGLQAILDGCCHLESLDLRKCMYLDLKGDILIKCLEKVKCVKLPNDSLEGLFFELDDRVAEMWSIVWSFQREMEALR